MTDGPWSSTPPRQLVVTCPICKKPVSAREHGACRTDDYIVYKLLQCPKCSEPIVVSQAQYGEDDDNDLRDPERVYPDSAQTLSRKIPRPLRREMEEARSCFDAKAYTATVVMVRRTLEGVCAQYKVTKHPLNKALAELESQGLIDGRLHQWADGLRALGNSGAHFTGTLVSPDDARDALRFAEALLDYLYVLAAQFEEFKARRSGAATQSDDDGE